MERDNTKTQSNEQTIATIYEEVKRKSFMDWGELEFAESVLQGQIKES